MGKKWVMMDVEADLIYSVIVDLDEDGKGEIRLCSGGNTVVDLSIDVPRDVISIFIINPYYCFAVKDDGQINAWLDWLEGRLKKDVLIAEVPER